MSAYAANPNNPILPDQAFASPARSEVSLPAYTDADRAQGGFEDAIFPEEVVIKEFPSLKYTFWTKGWNDVSLVEGGPEDARDSKDVAYFADDRGCFSHTISLLKGGRGSKSVVALISRQRRPGGEIHVDMDGKTYPLEKRGRFSRRDRVQVSFPSGNLTLLEVDSKKVLARFSHKFWSFSRRGTIEIWGDGMTYRELILATAITMEVREEELRRSAAAAVVGGGP